MEFEVVGWPDDGPTLALDHERFSYAGKFVMSNTGKAVLWDGERDDRTLDAERGVPRGERDDSDAVVAAVAFNEDRTDPGRLWLRYVAVRADRRGEGLGPRLLRSTVERALDRGYERVRMAVNNPFAYEAAWKAGFAFTGERTGIAELVTEFPRAAALGEGDPGEEEIGRRYREGLRAFRERESITAAEREFVAERLETGPPSPIESPDDV